MPLKWTWNRAEEVTHRRYNCGYCGLDVGPSMGFHAFVSGMAFQRVINICPVCEKPTFWDDEGKQHPSVRFGESVKGIDDPDIEALYDEARNCFGVGAYTSSVMTCRKLLMSVAARVGAKQGETFEHYVNFLLDNGWIPPNGKDWADSIRKKGNEANHKIHLMTEEEAKQVIRFVEMLLRLVFEFPAKAKGK